MSIISDEFKECLINNYGIFFKEVLTSLGLQKTFYDNELGIGKNRWASICEGKTYRSLDIDLLYKKTGINKQILKAEKMMYLYADSEDEYAKAQEKEMHIRDEINNFIKSYFNDPQKINNSKELKKYNDQFIKLFRYAISLSTKIDGGSDEKIKRSLEFVANIDINDYNSADPDILQEYLINLERHVQVIKAVQTINNFKNS